MARVALLWHMHQPFYQDPVTGEHILPWVRLHALKDYWGMAALLREFPGVKVTFNLVPSLLVQLEAFAREEARDRHLELGLKPAEALSDDERAFVVERFFHAHRPRMIDPFPRYAELLARRESAAGLSPRAQAAQFSPDDLRDLQVWHKLVWIDPSYAESDERIRALHAKGGGFSEADKQTLRAVELELLRRVIPEYREAAARGQVELSTSPFYHPILPLLCDTDVYLRAHPGARMPRERFRRPEDALEQLTRAVALHERLFGARPRGVWPSEGSVSDDMVPLVVQAGFHWMATDEEILARTTGRPFTRDDEGQVQQPEALYRPYRVGTGAQAVACGFRDHALSDLIGFTYAAWDAEAAADDFVRRLAAAGRRYRERTGSDDATIVVILDGENAWEYYEGQGRPFLRALYGRLSAHPELETVTMSEACADARETLPSIFPGSWINADFYIWIGHQDDQRAWSQLAAARRALDHAPPGLDPAAVARAREAILIAEGSDWFWWYGDDHSSDHDVEFDELFRRHVRNVYRALEMPIPEELFVSNISTQAPAVGFDRPTGFIDPTIDGEVTDYFEWVGAGCAELDGTAGAMHPVAAAAGRLELVEFGFNLERLFIRLDAARPMRDLLAGGIELMFTFLQPPGVRLVVRGAGGPVEARLLKRGEGGRWEAGDARELLVAAGEVLELALPFSALGVRTHDRVAFFVVIVQGEVETERHPKLRPIEFDVPDRDFAARNWTA
ncbi:MAG TPA: glycoside hydrolase family 57 protein [Vicinamibacterales bacterium]|nr:glycoside hydrolase family 57 protein [Vicinamibacterales bacterium]